MPLPIPKKIGLSGFFFSIPTICMPTSPLPTSEVNALAGRIPMHSVLVLRSRLYRFERPNVRGSAKKLRICSYFVPPPKYWNVPCLDAIRMQS